MNIAKVIKNDGVGVILTDTLYGIIGSAFSKKVVERIYELKGRDENKPFIVLISDITDLKKFGIKITSAQKIFLSKVWPGPVSVILPCKNKKFEYLHRGTKSLAFRLPKKKKLQTLLKKTGPLVAPSANPQGLPPAETITQAKKYFGSKIDFSVSGGRKVGKASTIISLLMGKPELIRGNSEYFSKLLKS